MAKEVNICGGPKCCTSVKRQDDGSVVMAEINTGKAILIPEKDWQELKRLIKSGEL